MSSILVNSQEIRETIGLPLEVAFAKLLGVSREDNTVKDAVKHYQALFKEIVLPNATNLIFDGVIEGLSQLRDEKIALAIATSKVYKSAQALVEAAGLWKYFDIVVGADDVSQPKPNPEMGYLVLSKLNMHAENAVMVGDTTHDLIMVNRAGLASIAVTYGIHDRDTLLSAEPTWVANSFAQVVTCIMSQ